MPDPQGVTPPTKKRRSKWHLNAIKQAGIIAISVVPWVILIGLHFQQGNDRPRLMPEGKGGRGGRGTAQPARQSPTASLPTASSDPLRRADSLLSAGNVEDAAAVYQAILEDEQTDPAHMVYRLAICRELGGQHDVALELYRSLVDPGLGPAIPSAARLGQARIHTAEQRLDAAQSLLAELMLGTGTLDLPPAVAIGDVAYLLGYVEGRRVLSRFDSSPLDDQGLAMARPRWSTDHLLKLIDPSHSQPREQDAQKGLHIAFRFGQSPEDTQIRGRIEKLAIRQVIQAIADLLEVPVVDTPQARRQLFNRTTSFQCPGINAGTALDALLFPHGLTWDLEGGKLRIWAISELDHQRWHQRQHRSAERSLENALTTYPDHPLAPLHMLLLGNLSFLSGDAARALSWFEQATVQHPLSAYRTETWFNRAKVYWKTNQSNEARHAFYQVVDTSPGHDLEGIGYLFLGRLFLEQGQLELAVRPLLRAATLTDAPHQAAAASTLASAYMLAGNAYAANLALVEYAQVLKQSEYHEVAAYLGNLSRFEAAQKTSDHMMHGRALVASTAYVHPDQFFGDYGVLLVARGLQRLGLNQPRIEVYEQSLTKQPPLPPNIEGQVRLELASAYLEAGFEDRAHQQLAQLVQHGTEPHRAEAQLRIIELRYRRGDLVWCLEESKRLLNQDAIESHKSRLLNLMGKIYEDQQQPFHAARCFAGLLPSDTSVHSPDKAAAVTSTTTRTQ